MGEVGGEGYMPEAEADEVLTPASVGEDRGEQETELRWRENDCI